jgi:hypothetical protein
MHPKKVILIRYPTLFEMEKAKESLVLATSMGDFVHTERPYGAKNLLLGTSALTRMVGSVRSISFVR